MLKKERNTIKYRNKHLKFSLVITYRDGFVLLHKTGNNPCSRSINAVAGQQQSILNLNTSLVINTLECYMCNGSSIFPGSNIQLNNSPIGKYPDNSYYTSATASSRYAGHCWRSKNEKWVTYFYGCQDIHGSSKARQWIKTYMHILSTCWRCCWRRVELIQTAHPRWLIDLIYQSLNSAVQLKLEYFVNKSSDYSLHDTVEPIFKLPLAAS